MNGRARRRIAGVLAAAVLAATRGYAVETRLTARERADLLEPWSLEIAPQDAPFVPAPGAPAGPAPPGATPSPAPGAPPLVPDDSQDAAAEQAGREKVLVIRCRQVVIGNPEAAERLARLLQGGTPYEAARRAVGSLDIQERTREYALDELQEDLQREVLALPEGGWTAPREWSGRIALIQVLSKEERERRTLPVLGQGLGSDEQNRLARAQRPQSAARITQQQQERDETRDIENAAIVQQFNPVYPPQATQAGQVTVVVQIGRAGDVVDVRVERSSDPVFDEAALDAARKSTYTPAKRDGIPEPGTVTLTFNFVAPQDPNQPPRSD